jgi:hypothetical protein
VSLDYYISDSFITDIDKLRRNRPQVMELVNVLNLRNLGINGSLYVCGRGFHHDCDDFSGK